MEPDAPAGKPIEQQASAKGNLEVKNLAFFLGPIDLNDRETFFKSKPSKCFRTGSMFTFEYDKILGQSYIYTFFWFLLGQKLKVTFLLS